MAWLEAEACHGGEADQGRDRLAAFRGELYRCLRKRPDALFELADAVLCKQDRGADAGGIVAGAGVPPRAKMDGAQVAVAEYYPDWWPADTLAGGVQSSVKVEAGDVSVTGVVLAGRTIPVSKEEFEKVQAVVAEGMAREGLQDVIVPPGEAAVTGPAEFSYPARDRNAGFEPVIVPKGTRRLGQVDAMILSLYSRA